MVRLKKTDWGEIVGAVSWLLVGLIGVIESARLPRGSPAAPGPGFVPLLAAVTLCVAAAFLVARSVLASRPVEASTDDRSQRMGKVGFVVVGLLGYALIFERLGFVAATFVTLVFLFKVVEALSWRVAVLAAALIAVPIYVIFTSLGAQLPSGPLFSPGSW